MEKIAATAFKATQACLSFADRILNDSHLGDPTFQGEPSPEYARLLAKGPIVRSYVIGGWAVLGFEAVVDALKDSRLSSNIGNSPIVRRMYEFASDTDSSPILERPMMTNTDPPEHGRLRKLARSGFLKRTVASLEPTIRGMVKDCLATLEGQETFDLVSSISRPIPARVIGDLLGIPLERREPFRKIAEEYLRHAPVVEFDSLRRANEAYQNLLEFMGAVIAEKREELGQDFTSQLIGAEEDGERLSVEEVVRTCTLLMAAGYDTTTRLIGNAVFLLLSHPEQLAQLRDNPDLIENAIEEVLRFESPVQLVLRVATEDLTLHGAMIRQGQTVIVILSSANRDPAANPEPDVFDITRTKLSHVGFGYGIHLCLGAELARLETRIVLEELLERYPTLTLMHSTPRWEPGYAFRGLEELQLAAYKPS